MARGNKTYNVTYTTESGFTETMEIDKRGLQDLISQEENGVTLKRLRDGFVSAGYKMKINNITTPYDTGRDLEFFSPGISKVDKYTNKASGYFIKDTRSNYKALAPGTNAILVFDTRDEARKYFLEHRKQIEAGYVAQKDSDFDLNDALYESVIYANQGGRLNLTGKGYVFPKDDIYTVEDIPKLSRLVASFEDFCARSERVQNLKSIRSRFDSFVAEKSERISDTLVRLRLDEFDKTLKPTLTKYVKAFPEMVNQSIINLRDRAKDAFLDKKERIQDSIIDRKERAADAVLYVKEEFNDASRRLNDASKKFNSSVDKFFRMAEEKDLVSSDEEQQNNDIIYD